MRKSSDIRFNYSIVLDWSKFHHVLCKHIWDEVFGLFVFFFFPPLAHCHLGKYLFSVFRPRPVQMNFTRKNRKKKWRRNWKNQISRDWVSNCCQIKLNSTDETNGSNDMLLRWNYYRTVTQPVLSRINWPNLIIFFPVPLDCTDNFLQIIGPLSLPARPQTKLKKTFLLHVQYIAHHYLPPTVSSSYFVKRKPRRPSHTHTLPPPTKREKLHTINNNKMFKHVAWKIINTRNEHVYIYRV